MRNTISPTIRFKLFQLLENVGDMSLKRRACKQLINLNLKANNSVVDLGCGDGFYLYLLNNLPLRLKLVGLDCDKVVLGNAKKNLSSRKIQLVQGDLIKLPFKDKGFDKAIMTEVLEHVTDDKKALSETHRILKRGGILVLTVPNYDFPFLWDPINWILQNLIGTHIGGIGFFAGIWARHKRLYKENVLKSLIENAGFKVVQVEQLTTRCLPFNHHLVNIVARLLYDYKLPDKIKDPISKFKQTKKPLFIKLAFGFVNLYDKLNDLLPGKKGLNIYIKAIKR